MSLDEERVDWLKTSDMCTESFYIRKPQMKELESFKTSLESTTLTMQVLNWFFYLEGMPPLNRGDYYDYFRAIDQVYKGLNKFYNKDLTLKEEYWYLEELYKIIRR